jgi:hypothetical protein
MIRIIKDKFIWFPQVGEKVKIKKKYLPAEIKDTPIPIYGKIKHIDGQYISVKYKGHPNLVSEHYRSELIPIGDFIYTKKNKK